MSKEKEQNKCAVCERTMTTAEAAKGDLCNECREGYA